jgi:hypothetical protein
MILAPMFVVDTYNIDCFLDSWHCQKSGGARHNRVKGARHRVKGARHRVNGASHRVNGASHRVNGERHIGLKVNVILLDKTSTSK